jgi:acyl carrier protein
MTNSEKYKQVFITLFDVTDKELQKLTYQGVDTWDSVGHMELITKLEETFNIIFETDDIVDFNCYSKGYEILSKYVAF